MSVADFFGNIVSYISTQNLEFITLNFALRCMIQYFHERDFCSIPQGLVKGPFPK